MSSRAPSPSCDRPVFDPYAGVARARAALGIARAPSGIELRRLKSDLCASEPDFSFLARDVYDLTRQGDGAARRMTDDQLELALTFTVALRQGVAAESAGRLIRDWRRVHTWNVAKQAVICGLGGVALVTVMAGLGAGVAVTCRALATDIARQRAGLEPDSNVYIDAVLVGAMGAVFLAGAAMTCRLAYAGLGGAARAISDYAARDMLILLGRTTLADGRGP